MSKFIIYKMKKQIIGRYSNSSISYKYYENDRGEHHGLNISYLSNGEMLYKTNYINGKRHGLSTSYTSNYKIEKQKYHL